VNCVTVEINVEIVTDEDARICLYSVSAVLVKTMLYLKKKLVRALLRFGHPGTLTTLFAILQEVVLGRVNFRPWISGVHQHNSIYS
jgi:hypothetical protein